jgi:hypothetical protein
MAKTQATTEMFTYTIAETKTKAKEDYLRWLYEG